MNAGVSANQVIESCGSTNDLARELGEQGAPHGTWISAREQERGRGRLGRQWQSLQGNLFLSVIARLDDKSLWTWVPLATAVAAVRLIESRYPMLASRLRIKWPNDLWIDGAKLGGILCEAVGTRTGSFIIIGLGMNCLHAPHGLDQKTASLSDAMGRPVTGDDLRAGIVESIVWTLDELAASGSAALTRDYNRFAAFPRGVEIEWGDQQRGHVLGLGSSGELVVTTAGGEELKLYAEDVRVKLGTPKASYGSLA